MFYFRHKCIDTGPASGANEISGPNTATNTGDELTLDLKRLKIKKRVLQLPVFQYRLICCYLGNSNILGSIALLNSTLFTLADIENPPKSIVREWGSTTPKSVFL